MAGSNPTPYYTPTSKHTAATYHSPFPLKRPNLYSLVAITFLCSAFYFTGLWQNRGSSSVITTSNIVHTTIPCFPSKNTSTNSPTSSKSTQKLDFTTHHSTDDDHPPLHRRRRRCYTWWFNQNLPPLWHKVQWVHPMWRPWKIIEIQQKQIDIQRKALPRKEWAFKMPYTCTIWLQESI